jgi:hypothetical protein
MGRRASEVDAGRRAAAAAVDVEEVVVQGEGVYCDFDRTGAALPRAADGRLRLIIASMRDYSVG